MNRKGWTIVALVTAAAAFAFQAGEYSTPQWLELRRKEKAEHSLVDSLAREVDSLKRMKRLVETDPTWQERIAREQYGMLRKGEFEFTVAREANR